MSAPLAFPFVLPDGCGGFQEADSGMALRDWFATFAPEMSKDALDAQRTIDRNRNPHNDSYKPPIRDEITIRTQHAYCWADAMLKARRQGQGL